MECCKRKELWKYLRKMMTDHRPFTDDEIKMRSMCGMMPSLLRLMLSRRTAVLGNTEFDRYSTSQGRKPAAAATAHTSAMTSMQEYPEHARRHNLPSCARHTATKSSPLGFNVATTNEVAVRRDELSINNSRWITPSP